MSRFKHIVKSVGTTLNNMAIASHDSEARDRIREIDTQIEQLRMERDYHIASLYEPRHDEVVSNDYKPGQWVPQYDRSVTVAATSTDGRITECPGRRYTGDYRTHPGCPYGEKNHPIHEFTLRD